MQVTQQQMPQTGAHIGDAKQRRVWGRETTICHILLDDIVWCDGDDGAEIEDEGY